MSIKHIKKVLKNGMTIVLVPIPNMQIISMGFFVKAGSRNETDKNSGIAHFLEHMMFKGTKTRDSDKLFDTLDTLGTEYNAATTSQTTYYYIYGNSDDTTQILDVMLDIYINPEFSNREISKEKRVIIEEMRTRMDAPLAKLYSSLHKKMFAGTSLARDIIGSPETVLNFAREDLIDFRTAMYTPKNTVFAIVGNFNPMAIYKMIAPILGKIKPSKKLDLKINNYANEKVIIMKNMEEQNGPYIHVRKNANYRQAYVLLAFPMYDLYNTQGRVIDLLTSLLSNGFTSRLNKALREDSGITYSISSYPIAYADCGMYLIQMIVNPDELVNGIKILMHELKRIKTEDIGAKEMMKIVNVTKNESIYSLIDPLEILTYFGLGVLSNANFKPNIKKEFAGLKKITAKQIQDVAKKIFIRDKINLYIYGSVEDSDFNFMDI